MSSSDGPGRSITRRLKIAAVSLLSLIVTSACALLRLRPTEEPVVLCYEVAAPTDPPTPVVVCYEVAAPTATPTLTCYTATPPVSPLSPLPTPTPSEEARGALREELLAGSRFPEAIARRLHE